MVPNFLKENSKARGSIYDREPRPRATSEKERRAISSPNLLISYRTKPAIADRLASLTHAKGSPSGTGKAYRTRSKVRRHITIRILLPIILYSHSPARAI